VPESPILIINLVMMISNLDFQKEI
jgi:hypothetical protein